MTNRPLLLDLFCGAGGCAVGYHRAGFDVVGVDIKRQPRYPFEFVHGDALDYCRKNGRKFDVIHASPPCQAYSICRNNGSHKNSPRLLAKCRRLLRSMKRPYIIENVATAPIENLPLFGTFAIVLCGASFGLGVSGLELSRHRLFESNVPLRGKPCRHTRGRTIGVYGNGTNSFHRNKIGRCVSVAECRQAMGIDWMVRSELTQAIPPAYTEFIGNQLMQVVQERIPA